MFEYELRTRIATSSLQSAVIIGYAILIGCLFSKSTKLVLESFMRYKMELGISVNHLLSKSLVFVLVKSQQNTVSMIVF